MKSRVILLVEDDPDTRTSMALLLEGEGHTVHTAANGQEALDYLRANPPPDLVLLDLMMQVMDGREFRRRQLQDPALASVPVVVLSAWGERAQQVDELGDTGYLQKPVEPAELLAAISRFAQPRKPEVLVVEDRKDVRMMVEAALRHCGFTVHTAATGPDAVALYRRHLNIDVVLLDVQMTGTDGPQTLELLRRIDPGVRCCFMTGHPGKYAAEQLLAMGAVRVLTKPFSSVKELQQAVWEVAYRA